MGARKDSRTSDSKGFSHQRQQRILAPATPKDSRTSDPTWAESHGFESVGFGCSGYLLHGRFDWCILWALWGGNEQSSIRNPQSSIRNGGDLFGGRSRLPCCTAGCCPVTAVIE
ncbi:MAG: hypothetical protein V3W34_17435 [Phycisphaerae bacterium]